MSDTIQQLNEIGAVAKQYDLSPETLIGVYGTESAYGQNLGPSSAGARGPFQFLPSTGAEYGLNTTTIEEFSPSLTAAAKYLHSLGANSNPKSAQTAAALNAYSGGGGTTYVNKVLDNGIASALAAAQDPIGGAVAGVVLGSPGGSGSPLNPGSLPSRVLGSDASSLDDTAPFSDLAGAIKWIGKNWLRIFEFLAGVGLVALSLHLFLRAGVRPEAP